MLEVGRTVVVMVVVGIADVGGFVTTATGVVAVVIGGIGGWAVMHFVMEVAYVFEPISAILIVFGGALATLLAGLAFSFRPLQARPANILRTQD